MKSYGILEMFGQRCVTPYDWLCEKLDKGARGRSMGECTPPPPQFWTLILLRCIRD